MFRTGYWNTLSHVGTLSTARCHCRSAHVRQKTAHDSDGHCSYKTSYHFAHLHSSANAHLSARRRQTYANIGHWMGRRLVPGTKLGRVMPDSSCYWPGISQKYGIIARGYISVGGIRLDNASTTSVFFVITALSCAVSYFGNDWTRFSYTSFALSCLCTVRSATSGQQDYAVIPFVVFCIWRLVMAPNA